MLSFTFVSALVVASALAPSAVGAPVTRSTAQLTQIVIFGDSFSDNGNGAWKITNHTWPADPAYYKGRFSNGPTWIEDTAAKLGLQLYDYAVGGSTSNNSVVQGYTGPKSTIPVPSAVEQFSAFLNTTKKGSNIFEKTLFAVVTGGNDNFFSPNVTGADTVTTIRNIVLKLSSLGAKHFVLSDYPDLSLSPSNAYGTAAAAAALHNYSSDLRSGLIALRSSLLKSHPSLTIAFVDPYQLWGDFFAHPDKYGFDKKTEKKSCLTGAYGETPKRSLCSDPDRYVYWDAYHPSRKAHKYFADRATKAIQKTIPSLRFQTGS